MSKVQSNFQKKVSKLYQLSMYGRWLFVLASWLTLGVYALWNLREEIAICWDYFTWAAVYYGLHFNFLPTLCLAFCIGVTTSVLVWQSRNLIWGLPADERQKLEKQVKKIMAKGNRHPLYRWIN